MLDQEKDRPLPFEVWSGILRRDEPERTEEHANLNI